MSKPHKHAEVIKAWADNPQTKVERRKLDHEKQDYRDWHEISASVSAWMEDFEYRIKPEKVYPASKMTRKEVCDAAGTAEEPVLVLYFFKVANAAVRHAIDNGQTFTAAAYEQLQQHLIDANSSLILARNEAIDSRANRVARDMAIAEAVRQAYHASKIISCQCSSSKIRTNIDLAEVIATVK